MSDARHVYVCLVHEQPQCVADLVRNLRYLDPDSAILLYNGGDDAELLKRAEVEAYGVLVHPSPTPQRWGKLHGYAFDCLRMVVTLPRVEALTIVDSDQLCVMRDYGATLLAKLDALGPGVGVLSTKPGRVLAHESCCQPMDHAYQELPRFEPYLKRFPRGDEAWGYHTFWPATVFTRAAAEALVELARDAQLQELLAATTMFASEETLLPALAVLAGLRVEENPFDRKFLQFRREHNVVSADMAILRKEVAFIHPVVRAYDDPVRSRVRQRFNGYA